MVYLYEEKETTKVPIVIKPKIARKFVLRKNTLRAMKARKQECIDEHLFFDD